MRSNLEQEGEGQKGESMKHLTETVVAVVFGILWLTGIVLAQGFWSTAAAICVPPYAWYLAVHADRSFRDGDLALKVAEEACAKMKPPSAPLLRSLAAAYAEKGRFDEAVRTARQARDVAMKTNLSAIAKGVEADITAYEGGRTIYQRR